MIKVFARCLNLLAIALVAVAMFVTESHSRPFPVLKRAESIFRNGPLRDLLEPRRDLLNPRRDPSQSPSFPPRSGTIPDDRSTPR
jgi:hypothetical protein